MMRVWNNIDLNQYKIFFISTTSKHNTPFLKLPDKIINDRRCLNLLISDEKIANEFIDIIDLTGIKLFADIENKQNIDLYRLFLNKCQRATVYPYKPNDITLEACNALINYKYHNTSQHLNILIYGTGNLAFKIALRMLEHGYNVYIDGRNKRKIQKLIDTLEIISFNKNVFFFNKETVTEKFNIFITFVSAEKVISKDYLNFFSSDALLIDGGIGNFSEDFINLATISDYSLVRLDVRIADLYLEYLINQSTNNFFKEKFGQKIYKNIVLISGGIIGKKGDVIIDSIIKPKQVIGIANGIGGLLNVNEYSEEERHKIRIINEEVISDS